MPLSTATRWWAAAMFATLAAAYSLSQFFRAANAVIAPDLKAELHLAPDDLGLLTGIFFLVFAACQIPVGISLDRFGARLTMGMTMGMAVAGTALFAASDGLAGLTLARALLGLGSCCLLMGPLVVIARWYPPERFTQLTAVIIGIGTLGNLVATAPLAHVAAAIGWRGAFWLMTGITATVTAAVWVMVRDAPPGTAPPAGGRESLRQLLVGVVDVFRLPGIVPILPIYASGYAVTIAILGLWGGPYLHEVHGLDGPARGNVLLVMAGATALGYFTTSSLDRRFDTRKGIVLVGGAINLACLGLLVAIATPPLWLITVVLGVLGYTSSYFAAMMAHGRGLLPLRLLGRGLTVLNMANILGVSAVQFLSGWLIASLTQPGEAAPEHAYRMAFALFAACLGISLVIYAAWVPDRRPSALNLQGQ